MEASISDGTETAWYKEISGHVRHPKNLAIKYGSSKDSRRFPVRDKLIQQGNISTKDRCNGDVGKRGCRVVHRCRRALGRVLQFSQCVGVKLDETEQLPSCWPTTQSPVGSSSCIAAQWVKSVHDKRGSGESQTSHISAGRDSRKSSQEWFSTSMWDCRDDVKLESIIGYGREGTVYKAGVNGCPVAVKVIQQQQSCSRKSGDKVFTTPEMSLIHGISHPNLVQVYGVHERGSQSNKTLDTLPPPSEDYSYLDILESGPCHMANDLEYCRNSKQNELWIVMEFCDRGSLWDAVQRGDFVSGGVPLYSKIMRVALEIACAMQYLHDIHIIHGDLKAQNIFLAESQNSGKNLTVKVGDFGLCRRPQLHRKAITTFSWGTVDHMAPETLRDGQLHFATDIFSFAIVLLEVITGMQPFQGMTTPAVVVAIVEGTRPIIPSTCPHALSELIRDCWHKDWKFRPTFTEIIHRLLNMMLKT